MRSIELFAGAGGLALGSAKAGLMHEAVIERDADAVATMQENKRRGFPLVSHWDIRQADVTTFDYDRVPEGLDVLVAGPPCQPFSLGGKHGSIQDHRNMFPEVARAARSLRPKALVVENVKGLLRSTFAKHFEYILLQLTYPEVVRRPDEVWTKHLSRLERIQTRGGYRGLQYRLVFRLLNAADYGVPQQRHRVFMVGFRSDLEVAWSFPEPTHTLDALLWAQWQTGEYWKRHSVSPRKRPSPPERIASRLKRIEDTLFSPTTKAWRTVRDAIHDLPEPTHSGTAGRLENHRFQPGARSYPGHTGSPLDLPAKALKAGDHGVPGGENMLASPDGGVRYFTVRESARLQCFPDEYVFCGSWTESMRQLGNAVPVTLGEVVTRGVVERLRPVGISRG